MPTKNNKSQKATESKEKPVKAQKETKYRTAEGQRKLVYRRFKEGEDFLPVEGDELVTMLEFEKQNMERFISHGGRPPTFETVDALQREIVNYWDYLSNANREDVRLIPDIEGLASYLNISRDTLNEWERTNYRGFSDTIKSTKNAIAAFKKQLALHGKIPPIVFATDFNNNHGYTQKQEVTVIPNNPIGESTGQKELAADYVIDVTDEQSDN